ncbi:hypothetical protein [Cyanobium sp. CH-040]|uniref:hypothetical protein n=1 Tax=Cyanobium sp. CH-040 TaxID=2823708 RepID=UPI0020CCC912|nr:hypothetical protein [Cyanobium sp. CH-040]MCP9927285.1 hypothetical protein [Cyanobium sp. CH-040]
MARHLFPRSTSVGSQALMQWPRTGLAEDLAQLSSWFAVALAHAMGRALGPEPVPPPLLGVQPYRDCPRRRRR